MKGSENSGDKVSITGASCNAAGATRDAALSSRVRGTGGLCDILTRNSSNDVVKAPVKVAVDSAALYGSRGSDIFLRSASTSLNLRRVHYKYKFKFLNSVTLWRR